jgi:hypothetical protein
MPFKIKIAKNISPALSDLSKAFSANGDRISWPGGTIDNYTFAFVTSLKTSPKVEAT